MSIILNNNNNFLKINITKEVNINQLFNEIKLIYSNLECINKKGDEYEFVGLINEDINTLIDNHIPKIILETLASKYAKENGFKDFTRDIDVPLDTLEFFQPKEKIYNLKGEPIIKSYMYGNISICDILYTKNYENITYENITKNEFTSSKTIFRFYTKEDKSEYKDKIINSLPFTLVPTFIGNDVLWSSVKREEVLRSERYKSEEVMKTFNPLLYNLFTQIFGNSWQRYKETGDKTQLVNELNNAPHILINENTYLDDKLNEQVTDEDKIAIGLTPETSITILELILNSLQ